MIQEVYNPASIKEAVELKSSDTCYMAGGTQLNWTPFHEARRLVGKPQIEKVILLQNLLPREVKKEGGALFLGAGLTMQELIDSTQVPEALQKAAGYISSRNIRNMATLGGNIAANRSESFLLPCLIALKADVETANEGIMCVEKYIRDEKDSLITQIILPEVSGTCILDVARKSSGAYPSSITAVRISDNDAVIVVGCVSSHVVRLKNIEAAVLDGSLRGESLVKAVSDSIDPESDLQGSAVYKKYISGTMIAHSVDLSFEEQSGKGA